MSINLSTIGLKVMCVDLILTFHFMNKFLQNDDNFDLKIVKTNSVVEAEQGVNGSFELCHSQTLPTITTKLFNPIFVPKDAYEKMRQFVVPLL